MGITPFLKILSELCFNKNLLAVSYKAEMNFIYLFLNVSLWKFRNTKYYYARTIRI